MRTVAVVTGSRAEYGLVQPIMRALKDSTDYTLQAAACRHP
jgi:UDP-N-acetylglucosamine 2-epimerase